jgi:hypothetical protein
MVVSPGRIEPSLNRWRTEVATRKLRLRHLAPRGRNVRVRGCTWNRARSRTWRHLGTGLTPIPRDGSPANTRHASDCGGLRRVLRLCIHGSGTIIQLRSARWPRVSAGARSRPGQPPATPSPDRLHGSPPPARGAAALRITSKYSTRRSRGGTSVCAAAHSHRAAAVPVVRVDR